MLKAGIVQLPEVDKRHNTRQDSTQAKVINLLTQRVGQSAKESAYVKCKMRTGIKSKVYTLLSCFVYTLLLHPPSHLLPVSAFPSSFCDDSSFHLIADKQKTTNSRSFNVLLVRLNDFRQPAQPHLLINISDYIVLQ